MKDKITAFLQERLGNDLRLGDDDNIFEKGMINSLFALQLVLFVEKNFQIEIDSEDLDIRNFSTINNLVKLVQKKRKTTSVSLEK